MMMAYVDFDVSTRAKVKQMEIVDEEGEWRS
jgi:hypothetical protein